MLSVFDVPNVYGLLSLSNVRMSTLRCHSGCKRCAVTSHLPICPNCGTANRNV